MLNEATYNYIKKHEQKWRKQKLNKSEMGMPESNLCKFEGQTKYMYWS